LILKNFSSFSNIVVLHVNCMNHYKYSIWCEKMCGKEVSS